MKQQRGLTWEVKERLRNAAGDQLDATFLCASTEIMTRRSLLATPIVSRFENNEPAFQWGTLRRQGQ